MSEDGGCPTCGSILVAEAEPTTPWHFKLLVASAAVYLGWRAVQGVVWVVDHVG
ncbi:MAG TPA: hypothetical protein VGA13_11620 [Acidimicrobiales bacterium]|jgi:hypothetical protein